MKGIPRLLSSNSEELFLSIQTNRKHMFFSFAKTSVSYLCDPGGEVLLVSPEGFCEV